MGIPSLPIPRLTEEELCRFWSSVSQTKTCWNWIARRLGVHKKTVYKVIKGVAWKHV